MNLELPVTRVPYSAAGWDVTWLGAQAGWLDGSAFPTWSGNTILTAHVWDAQNQPGPFLQLKTLRYGEVIFLHAWGDQYRYEVRENRLMRADQVENLFQQEDLDWLTLVTCEGYDEEQADYAARRVVRAVRVKME